MQAFKCGRDIIIARSISMANMIRARKGIDGHPRRLTEKIKWRFNEDEPFRESWPDEFKEGTVIEDRS